MSGTLNKTILIGRLGADPNSAPTESGITRSRFSIATDDTSFKDANGELQQRTEWHNIVAWRRLADICNQYLTKGSLVYVEGKATTRSWDDKEGNKKTTHEVLVDHMTMLGNSKSNHDAVSPPKDKSTAFTSEGDVPF